MTPSRHGNMLRDDDSMLHCYGRYRKMQYLVNGQIARNQGNSREKPPRGEFANPLAQIR